MYEYSCHITRVIDGDTVVAEIDLGFNIRVTHAIRLTGINAPERGTPEGDAATAYLSSSLPPMARPTIQTKKPLPEDKYGRWLGTIILDAKDINQSMIEAGHAVAWDGKGKRP